jgi:hypothetical protein
MSDGRSYDPFQPATPQQSRPAELLWTLRKGTDRKTAELRTHGGGVELQFSHNGVWYYGRRHEVRALALDEAAAARREFEADGWTEQSEPHARSNWQP